MHACINACMYVLYEQRHVSVVLYICMSYVCMNVCMHHEHIPYIMIVGGISNDPWHKTLVEFRLIFIRE